MKQISLSQGLFAMVDGEDYDFLMQWKWWATKTVLKNRTIYRAARTSLVSERCSRKTIYMHHAIIGFPESGMETDHKDGNDLNNQRFNIHNVTHCQNQQNRFDPNVSSQYPGVFWDKIHKKWCAIIQIKGRRNYLGFFKEELEAFQAYQQALEELGEVLIDS